MNPIYGTIHSCNIIPRQERDPVGVSTPLSPPSDQFDAWITVRVHLPYGTEIPIGGGVFIKSSQPEVLNREAISEFFLMFPRLHPDSLMQATTALRLVGSMLSSNGPATESIRNVQDILSCLFSAVYQTVAPMNGVGSDLRSLAKAESPTNEVPKIGKVLYSGGQEPR